MTTPVSTTEAETCEACFEAWYSIQSPAYGEPMQLARDAYFAGIEFAQSRASAQGGERVDKGAAFKAFCEFHGFRPTARELTFFDAGFMAATPPATTGMKESLVGDAERLDFLDSMGGNWVARQSVIGRGYRLHQDRDGPHATARAALDAAIRAGRKG